MIPELTHEQWSMIQYWRATNSKIGKKALVDNLVKRFLIERGVAWVLVSRLINAEHTRNG